MKILQEMGESYFATRYSALLYLNSEVFNLTYSDSIDEVNESLINASHTSSVVSAMSSHYKVLGELGIEKGDSYFLDALYSQKISNIIILGFIIYVVNYFFFVDEDEKMDDVIKLTLKGEQKIIFDKIAASLIMVLFFSFLSTMLNYAYLMWVYSIPNISHNIQSFTQYFTSP